MKKVKEILNGLDFTIEEFWDAVDALSDDNEKEKKHKKNINAFFKKDGTPKAKALAVASSTNIQDWHSTNVFIKKNIRDRICMKRRKNKRSAAIQRIRDIKAGKVKVSKKESHG